MKLILPIVPVMITFQKELINNKSRRSLFIQYFNVKKCYSYFLQSDTNIWWKPRKCIEKDDNVSYTSYGWLFVQVGKAYYLKWKKQE